jgi:PAS domain S-box-containing protein
VRSESTQAALRIARNAFVSVDGAGRVREWNPRAAELFGYPREDAIGKNLADLIVPPRYREQHRAGLQRAVDAGLPGDRRLIVEALRRDGREFPVEVSITSVREDDATVFHAWIVDVSERHQLLGALEAQLRGRDPGFGEILDALAEAVTIRDPHHHILYANRAALHSMGFASLAEMQRQPPHAIFDEYLVHDEHGHELTMDNIPSVRLLAGEPAEPLVLRTIHRTTGELRWELLKAAPLHDSDGRTVAAVTIIEDITRERVAELRDRFMARASDTLMSSLDYQETLRNVAWLAVPDLADWCTVELVDERGIVWLSRMRWSPTGLRRVVSSSLRVATPGMSMAATGSRVCRGRLGIKARAISGRGPRRVGFTLGLTGLGTTGRRGRGLS